MDDKLIISTVCSLFEQLIESKRVEGELSFPSFEPNEGLHFCVEVSGRQTGYDSDGNYHEDWALSGVAYFHIILLSGKNVFTCISDYPKINNDDMEWKNTSNHCSEWRHGMRDLFQLGMQMHTYIYSKTPKEHTPVPLHGETHMSLTPMFDKPFRCVRVTHESDKSRNKQFDNYFRKVTFIEIIEKTITV